MLPAQRCSHLCPARPRELAGREISPGQGGFVRARALLLHGVRQRCSRTWPGHLCSSSPVALSLLHPTIRVNYWIRCSAVPEEWCQLPWQQWRPLRRAVRRSSSQIFSVKVAEAVPAPLRELQPPAQAAEPAAWSCSDGLRGSTAPLTDPRAAQRGIGNS